MAINFAFITHLTHSSLFWEMLGWLKTRSHPLGNFCGFVDIPVLTHPPFFHQAPGGLRSFTCSVGGGAEAPRSARPGAEGFGISAEP